MESNHHGQAYETCFLQGTQRLRRHDLHVRPSAHEADELLLLHSAVETDENRTRIVRVQTGCSPVELQPRISRQRRGAATVNRTRISSLARSRPAIGPWPQRAPVRNCTEACRLRNGCSTLELQGQRRRGARPARTASPAPAEGFEPPSFRLTIGRLTVRPR
jgi:hypothetical protein